MTTMKKRIKAYLVLGFVALWGVMVFNQNIGTLLAQANIKTPNVTKISPLGIAWTAGSVLNGGHPVAVTAGSAAVTANENDCSSPGYAACNFVISSSGGSVTVTTSSGSAIASGVTLLAIIETGASSITQIVYENQTNNLKKTN